MSKPSETFLFNSIRKYNRSRRQTQRDVVLHAVGVRAGLIECRRTPLPILSEEERDRVLSYLREFLASQNLKIVI
jgi:hypothetical protein